MKKLGKKKVEAVKTIEAYGDSAACSRFANDNYEYYHCYCDNGMSHSSDNNRKWTAAYNTMN